MLRHVPLGDRRPHRLVRVTVSKEPPHPFHSAAQEALYFPLHIYELLNPWI
jgi:hypothetical protein